MEPNLILTTRFLNLNGGMHFVKGSTIINSMLTCSMTIFFPLTCSFMTKYFMLMYLLRLPLKNKSSYLRKKCTKIINKYCKPYGE